MYNMTKFQVTEQTVKASPSWELGKWVLAVPLRLLPGYSSYYVRDTEAEVDTLIKQLEAKQAWSS